LPPWRVRLHSGFGFVELDFDSEGEALTAVREMLAFRALGVGGGRNRWADSDIVALGDWLSDRGLA